MSNAWTGFAQGLAQGAQTGLNLYSQYQGLERQKKLDEQNDAKFQAWQNDQAYKDQTRQQRATLADDVQNGVVNNERTAVGLNTMSAGNPDAQQWTPQQVAGLSRGPGGAFDPNAGPYLPAQREAMKDSEKYTRMSGLAMREGNDAAALQLGEAARTTKIREGVGEFMKEYDAAPDKFDQHISRYANAKTSSLMLGDRDKKGYRQVLIRDANSDAKPVNLSPTDMRQLAMGYAHMQAGDNDGAMAIFKSVNKDLAEAIARDNATTVQATTLNNTATHYANQDDNAAARLGIDRERLSLAYRQAGEQSALARMGNIRSYTDPKTGEVKEFYPVVTKGVVQWQEFQRPQGLVPYVPRKPVSEADVQKYAEGLVGQTITTPDGRPVKAPDGTIRKYDIMTARQAVLEQLNGVGQQGGLPLPQSGDARAATIAALTGGAPAPAPAAPPGGLRIPAQPSLREVSAAARAADGGRRITEMVQQGAGNYQPLAAEDLDALKYLSR